MENKDDFRIVTASQSNRGTFGWIDIFSLFSFNNYFDPNNVLFGSVTVFNEYVIPSDFGFPMHPHENMELALIVLEGSLSFRDQSGQSILLNPGGVTSVSAGSGHAHSIHNYSDKPLKLIAVWMLPTVPDTPPFVVSGKFPPELWKNRLCPLVSGERAGGKGAPSPVPLASGTDGTLYRLALEASAVRHEMPEGSCALLYVISGQGEINGCALAQGGHVRVGKARPLEIAAKTEMDCILVTMPQRRAAQKSFVRAP